MTIAPPLGNPIPHRAWADMAATMTDRPGEWFAWPHPLGTGQGRLIANNVNAGRITALASVGEFRATVRRSDLFIRYVGP